MTKKILINAQDSNEIRVAVVDDRGLIDFDSEVISHKPIRGNIYLGRVVHIEPALQAVFVEYAEGKSGFLPFSEIHPDYYQIPSQGPADAPLPEGNFFSDFEYPLYENIEPSERIQNSRHNNYRIQEVIHNKQVLLVQILKDERGSKSAALTTYLSLAGQYCVLMPNAGTRSGGISKRIYNGDDRKRLKEFLDDLNVPEKMSVIIRTAGQERTPHEIKKDYEYLLRLWNDIRQKTLKSMAPCLIHEESGLLIRAIRDYYKKDINEILVDTQEAYQQIRKSISQLSKSGIKKVKLYQDPISLFNAYNVEHQILEIMSPKVELPSGGSLVIMQTEALVSIDINSGRATKERDINTTALKTNLEATKEIARQIRLRDLSGLIVIDFIDMHVQRHIQQVEKAFRKEMMNDNARTQVANMSQFCLLEMSRQRLKSSIAENYSEICPYCQGRGVTYSKRYFLSTIVHFAEKVAMENPQTSLTIYTPQFLCVDLLNAKRRDLFDIEQKTNCTLTVSVGSHLSNTDFLIDCGNGTLHQFSLDSKEEEDNIRSSDISSEKVQH